MNNVFNITFEFDNHKYEASVAFIEPIGDPQYHVNIKDPTLIERFQNNFIFTDKTDRLTYSLDSAGFMKSIATGINKYIIENKTIPAAPKDFTEEG